MRIRGLLFAAAALVLVTAGLWWSNKIEAEKGAAPDADAPPLILEIAAADIQEISITKGGETVTVRRGNNDNWELTSPRTLRADQDAAASLANTFASLSSERLVEENAADPARFGLASPSLAVQITRKDGSASRLLVGDETPTGGSLYVKLDGDPRVFTLAAYRRSSLDKGWRDLEDKRLMTFAPEQITRVDLTLKGQQVEFGRNSRNEWQIVRPRPMRADTTQLDDLVRKLQYARKDPTLPAEQAGKFASAFSSASPAGAARITDASGTQQIEVRKGSDNTYYARSSVVEGVHKVTDLGDALSRSITDFRNTRLFDFGFAEPGKVEFTSEGSSRAFERKENQWFEGSTQLDSISLTNLTDKLRDLTATAFPESGFTTPVVEATVTSNEGKRVEKIQISQAGDRFIARRENEPSLYELSKETVDELRRAASDVKAAPPPAP